VFLIAPEDGRVLYTVMKETDVGIPLANEKYRGSPLASIFRKVMDGGPEGGVVLQDYKAYEPSGLAPAAFMAVPVIRAGDIDGVLAIQVSSDEVNEVMDGGGHWREQGLGDTGQVFAVGPDNTLRSDLRQAIEDPDGYLAGLQAMGIPAVTVDGMRRQRTAVLAYPIKLDVVQRVRGGTEVGHNMDGAEVLRTHAPAKIDGLEWQIVAEIDKQEALAPVAALQRRIWMVGLGVGVLFFLAARWLAVSVTGPVLAVAAGARVVGGGVRGLRIANDSKDEIGQLAVDFNRMMEDLERTTVSRDDYQALAGRLITTQEDERRRIARELHDDLTQRLAAAAIEIGRLEKVQDSERTQGLAELKQRMVRISDDVHRLSRHLHPAMLDDLGLPAAVESECRASFERGGPIVSVKVDGSFRDVPKDIQLALYRMTQEALRNIQKHAGAEEAELRLMRGEETVELAIRDRGAGFDRSRADWKPGLGLASMEERVRLLGGQVWIDSRVGNGTSIHVKLPLPKESHEEASHHAGG
jgi:signal transduction histidine kinase